MTESTLERASADVRCEKRSFRVDVLEKSHGHYVTEIRENGPGVLLGGPELASIEFRRSAETLTSAKAQTESDLRSYLAKLGIDCADLTILWE